MADAAKPDLAHGHHVQGHAAHDHQGHDHGGARAGGVTLTRNQSLVLGILEKADAPVTAYGILDALRPEGIRAPLQVYRALDKLIELGVAHRLESINAFVSCQHDGCHDVAGTVFMLCEKCGHAEEMADAETSAHLGALALMARFKPARTTIEMRGLCAACAGT